VHLIRKLISYSNAFSAILRPTLAREFHSSSHNPLAPSLTCLRPSPILGRLAQVQPNRSSEELLSRPRATTGAQSEVAAIFTTNRTASPTRVKPLRTLHASAGRRQPMLSDCVANRPRTPTRAPVVAFTVQDLAELCFRPSPPAITDRPRSPSANLRRVLEPLRQPPSCPFDPQKQLLALPSIHSSLLHSTTLNRHRLAVIQLWRAFLYARNCPLPSLTVTAIGRKIRQIRTSDQSPR
jgi:hypothetical protein